MLQLSHLLTTKEVADMLGVSPGTLNVWRCTQRYPLTFIKVGRSVRYRMEDVEDFLRSRTSQVPP
jgi:excisionase family DNA binding protein